MTAGPPHNSIPAPVIVLLVTRGLSSIGTTLTSFGLDVWVFQQTGSYAAFATMAMLTYLPVLLFAPFAGLLTDRFDRKSLLNWADGLSAAAVLSSLLLYWNDALTLPAVGLTVVVLALSAEMRWSSLGAAMSQIAPKEALGRVNGIQQAFRGANVMLGPILGALGLDLLGLSTLLLVDVLTYVASIAALMMLNVDMRTSSGQRATRPGFMAELLFGFRWVWGRTGLRRLLVFFMTANIGICVFTATVSPYLLSVANGGALAGVRALLGTGAFVCGVHLGRSRKEGADHEARIVWGTMVFGMCMAVWGLLRTPALLFVDAFAIGVVQGVIGASSQTAWQLHVPKDIQGKVFAVRTVVAFGLAPMAILCSVPLATSVFQPLLQTGGAWTDHLWGQPPAGPMGLMVSVLGVGVALHALRAIWAGGLRLAESEVHVAAAAASSSIK